MTMPEAQSAQDQGPDEGISRKRPGSYDEADFKGRLSEEYKILQDKIDKIGGFRFTIKGWSITAVVAGIATAGGRGLATSCTVTLGLVLMLIFFFILEHEQVRQSRLFGDRAGRIEDAFRKISRGKGQEVYASLPVPYLAHELVRARLQKNSKSRTSQTPTPDNPSARGAEKWRTLGQAHVGFYLALILLAVASLLPQHRAIGKYWSEFTQTISYISPKTE
jgi:hypothetical protein